MRGWIPAFPMMLGSGALGLSWVLLFAIARTGSLDASMPALAWLHLIALGWITLVALSVLLHVIPAFLDIEWRLRWLARIAVLAFAGGTAILLAGFWFSNSVAIETGGTIVPTALLLYIYAATTALLFALRNGDRTVRAIARAFCVTFSFLLATAGLGVAFAYALGGRFDGAILLHGPQAHAILGIGGWLTLLIIGVSTRTIGPLTGGRSPTPALHAIAAGVIAVGVILAAVAAFGGGRLALVGLALTLGGVLVFAFDIGQTLRRAVVTHRPPQALMACGAFAAILAALLALGATLGQPYGTAAIFLALMGWAGSAVLAHMHHIGVRVLLTQARGEDDETRPDRVLVAPLTWFTVCAYEAAVALGTAGILCDAPSLVEWSALAGVLSFVSMMANGLCAYRAAAFCRSKV